MDEPTALRCDFRPDGRGCTKSRIQDEDDKKCIEGRTFVLYCKNAWHAKTMTPVVIDKGLLYLKP